MGGGLVGDDVDDDVARAVPRQQRRDHLGGVPEQPDRQRTPRAPGLVGAGDGVIEVGGLDVQVAVLDAPRDAGGVALDHERHAVVHGDGQRLRATHAAEAGGEGDGSGEGAAEPLARDGPERLERALQDALSADVDPRSGGHLAVDHEASLFERAEVIPGGPVADEVGVREQDARRPRVGPEDSDRLPGLDQQRLVALEVAQLADDRVERLPASRRASGAAVDHEAVRVLGDLGVEVVHEHPQRRLLRPALAGQVEAAGGPHGSGAKGEVAHGGSFRRWSSSASAGGGCGRRGRRSCVSDPSVARGNVGVREGVPAHPGGAPPRYFTPAATSAVNCARSATACRVLPLTTTADPFGSSTEQVPPLAVLLTSTHDTAPAWYRASAAALL